MADPKSSPHAGISSLVNKEGPTTPTPGTPTQTPTAPAAIDPRLTPFIEGFKRAIITLQGGVPGVWADREKAATVLALSIPRLTTARLIVWGRDSGQSVAVMAARVLSDMFATEPGLLELTPEEAAEEGATLMQTMWPQAAFQPRVIVSDEPEIKHPILDKLRKLAGQWHRLAMMPIDQAKHANPTLWRAKVLNDIAIAKSEGLQAGLTRKKILDALESAGDRWSWEIPPPAAGFYNDEFGQAPQGTEVSLANMPN